MRTSRLTIPHFSSLLAAERYHKAALRRAFFMELKRAAWANKSAEGGSSALIFSDKHEGDELQ